MSIDLTSDLINGKHVAVVGNSKNISQRKDGIRIDAHDVVIRFNFAFPEPELSESLGNRTDIMICARGILQRVHRKESQWNMLSRRHPNTHLIGRHPTGFLEYHLPKKALNECKELISKEPTTGAITVHSLMTIFNPAWVTVFGFDGLKSGVWYSNYREFPPEKNSHYHSPEREQAWLESVKDKLAVIEYD